MSRRRVCDLHTCQGYHADCSMWTSGGVQEVFRENHPDSCIAETVTITMCDLQSKNTTPQVCTVLVAGDLQYLPHHVLPRVVKVAVVCVATVTA
ncbi:unnamed protein product [Acanthoscelides obtectus]|uniref:Uncharacterized protein n=1 Tax=Acanthoscelides obtectus TaxID=200917 RepID=A0A9P0KE32_ACAOB|nr:unnamed protein product [Acanthoscelides obtectus]CAK1635523.1 hypothetical protein AOBTE_LOCUS9333 [Acanthoscelides obtectus]